MSFHKANNRTEEMRSKLIELFGDGVWRDTSELFRISDFSKQHEKALNFLRNTKIKWRVKNFSMRVEIKVESMLFRLVKAE